MTTPRKTFQTARDDADVVPFDIDGEEFIAVGPQRLPPGVMIDIAGAETSKDIMVKMAAFGGFFDGVLLPESAERFAARMRDPERTIDWDTLGDIVVWLIEEVYTDRPTMPSSDSSTGSEPTTPTSTGTA